MQEWACLDLRGQHPWCRAAYSLFLLPENNSPAAPVPLGEAKAKLLLCSGGETPAFTSFLGLQHLQRCLGSQRRRQVELSAGSALWGGVRDQRVVERLLPEGRKAIKGREGGLKSR